jgi:hypothetical protein
MTDMKKILAIIIVVAVLGAGIYAGWYFYTQRPTKNTPNSSNQTSQTSNDGYLVIKEWGVMLKKDPVLGNITYTFQSGPAGNQPTAILHMEALNSLLKECKTQVTNQWTIIRFAPDDPSPIPGDFTNATGAVKIKDSKNNTDMLFVKVNDYYYGQGHPQLPCNEIDKTKASVIYEAFIKMFRSIGPAP